MKSYQIELRDSIDFNNISIGFDPDLILIFTSSKDKEIEGLLKQMTSKYSNAIITGCSTAGQIIDTKVVDDAIIFNAIKFDNTKVKLHSVKIGDYKSSLEAGDQLRKSLDQEDLSHILVLSDGLNVNGAQLVKGLTSETYKNVSITGGLAGDGSDFKYTYVINNGIISENEIVGIGFYGDKLKVGYGSKGGWDSFGIERVVTKSKDNILYEIDNKPALDLYKSFLGSEAINLPSSGLKFPLSIRTEEGSFPVVRTILAIDEATNSLVFAGDIPEGAYARLMKSNLNHIIMGAEDSARICKSEQAPEPEFSILISCVGRRLVLNQLVEEEIDAVRDVLGKKPHITGFYSYGELAPFGEFNPCQLHNQTMTITTFSEN